MWAVASVLLLLCCCCSSVAGAVWYQGEQQKKIVGLADEHYRAAERAIENAGEGFSVAEARRSSSIYTAAIGRLNEAFDEAEKELDAAREDLKGLDSGSEVRKTYEAGLDEAEKAISLMGGMTDLSSGANSYASSMKRAVDLVQSAMEQYKSAGEALENKAFKTCADRCDRSLDYLRKAKAELQRAEDLNPGAGAKDIEAFVDQTMKTGTLMRDIANALQAGDRAKLGRLLKEFDAATRKLGKMKPPQGGKDYITQRAGEVQDEVKKHSDKADELIKKAHELL